ncbi:DegT/DnrJ/EryC1/StrS family aminotransferase [Saccharopolyspora sp. NPDC002376]
MNAPIPSPARTTPWPSWPVWDDAESTMLRSALKSGRWSAADGELKQRFEQAWSEYLRVEHAVAVTNGTISLEIALQALGIGHGDEVIVPPYTFFATASAVLKAHAVPVFADVDPATLNLSPAALEEAVTDRTKAVILVHFAGQPADLDAIGALCRRHGLALIEDAAHAHGARWSGRPVGGEGAFGSWSFQSSKNLSAGEGGALTTRDADLHAAAVSLHNCGRTADGAWYEHHELGGNYRLTEWQAAILLSGLTRLDDQIAARETSAGRLNQLLGSLDGIQPLARDPRATTHAHHLYAFRYDSEAFAGVPRDRFVELLRHHGIPASAGYPLPLYRQPVFAEGRFDRAATGWDGTREAHRYADLHLSVVEDACRSVVWLPQPLLLAPADEMSDVAEAIEAVRRWVR